jgi:hypothetical protein
MTVREQSPSASFGAGAGAGPAADLGAGIGPPPDLMARRRAGPCSHDDLAEADRLIADLAALVDAGLVVVQEHVLGPARYGVGADMEDAA